MVDRIALRMMRCPKCGSKHIDGFDDGVFWFMCRDCGYNSPAYHDECRAINAFIRGQDPNETPMDEWDGIPDDMRNAD